MQLIIFLKIFVDEIKNTYNEIEDKCKQKEKYFETEIQKYNRELELLKSEYEIKEKRLRSLITTSRPFGLLASMKTDMEMVVFQNSISYLKYKKHHAYRAADEVKRIKDISSQIHKEANEIKYKYEYLLECFPEIREYVDDDEDLLSLKDIATHTSLTETRDRRNDYLTKEEYERLSETEKSELALKRYLERPKTKWQIGRDYEMSCAFQLQSQGYSVELHGIKYGLKDLGRDLIAIKNTGEILIIQCKKWSSKHTIRENVIMQLYGSTIMYNVELNGILRKKIVPVLMIPPQSIISDVAIKFAQKLNVKIIRIRDIDFPRIKCNINNNEKIYHLPFDQQYDRTEIKNNGECYAWTIKEAEGKGFRRAKRYIFS